MFGMAVSALLVCREDEPVRVIRRALDELGIASDVCGDPQQALIAVGQQKYDAVVVDCDDLPGGGALMRDVRRGTSNRMSIVFALTRGTSVRAAFDLGANFVLEKPVIAERVSRSLRAAHGLMMRERRRYSRQPVNVPAVLSLANGTAKQVVISDVSEGGVALRGVDASQQGAFLRLSFELPRARKTFEVRGEVSWTGPDGRAGFRFSGVSDSAKDELLRWLSAQYQQAEDVSLYKTVENTWARLDG
jgi:CheY-like chemotaxis protein